MTNRIRSISVWLMILMLAAGSGTFSALAQDAVLLFEADGIEETVLAQADLAQLDAGATLLLELIELAPTDELPMHQTASPELFYVLAGVVTFHDEFGFVSAIDAGRVVALNAGTGYTISNAKNEAGRLLRLRVVDGSVAPPGATPAAREGDGTTGAAAVTETTVLMQAPLEGVELEGARMYLGLAQFGANSDSGEQGHAGPLGIYVDSGTLNVVSPSGLVGGIEAGRAVTLPAATPMRASTGDSEALVFLAVVAEAEDAAFTEIPSENSITEPGTMLEAGETWRSVSAELTVDFVRQDRSVKLDIIYVNTGNSSVEVRRTAGRISVIDSEGDIWRVSATNCPTLRKLEPGDSITCSYTTYPPNNAGSGSKDITFTVLSLGDIENAAWQLDIDW